MLCFSVWYCFTEQAVPANTGQLVTLAYNLKTAVLQERFQKFGLRFGLPVLEGNSLIVSLVQGWWEPEISLHRSTDVTLSCGLNYIHQTILEYGKSGILGFQFNTSQSRIGQKVPWDGDESIITQGEANRLPTGGSILPWEEANTWRQINNNLGREQILWDRSIWFMLQANNFKTLFNMFWNSHELHCLPPTNKHITEYSE